MPEYTLNINLSGQIDLIINGSAIGYKMNRIDENYQRITDDKRLFDIRFWQSQGDLAIFEAVTEMLNDYFLIRGQNADESRLQRTIENFRKA